MRGAGGKSTLHVATYVFVVVVLSVPFWVAGSLIQTPLLPGLSFAAFATVVPTISAVFVAAATGGRQAVRALFASLRAPWKRKSHIVLAAIAVPLIVAAASWSLSGTMDQASAGFGTAITLIPVLLIAAVAEEIGWSEFATKRLSRVQTELRP